jgi:hypothetical protein
MVARYIESVGGDAIVDVNEVWMLPPENAAVKAYFDDAQYVPGRGEALSVLVATRELLFRSYITPFTRGPFGGIKLGETIEAQELPYYLKPVIDVWRIQGTLLMLSPENDCGSQILSTYVSVVVHDGLRNAASASSTC